MSAVRISLLLYLNELIPAYTICSSETVQSREYGKEIAVAESVYTGAIQ